MKTFVNTVRILYATSLLVKYNKPNILYNLTLDNIETELK